ncbi:MAG: hypothetical protein HZC54_09760 [Verrucomicrobia bacterium]|nr:hypothetical protein [Verrucomicrobiota bacterium]
MGSGLEVEARAEPAAALPAGLVAAVLVSPSPKQVLVQRAAAQPQAQAQAVPSVFELVEPAALARSRRERVAPAGARAQAEAAAAVMLPSRLEQVQAVSAPAQGLVAQAATAATAQRRPAQGAVA